MSRRVDDRAAEMAIIGQRFEELDRENAELRERVERAERERDTYRSELHSVGEALALANATTLDLLGVRSELRAAQARLARYEAPGPALLVAEHAEDCNKVAGLDRSGCTCGLGARVLAYREQHARCVAVVERVFRKMALNPSTRGDHGEDAVGEVLAALTGEAEK